MGKALDYVPTQLTTAFRDAQASEEFQDWLKMQGAVMDIEFPFEDVPEVRDKMFEKDSLNLIEAKLPSPLGVCDTQGGLPRKSVR